MMKASFVSLTGHDFLHSDVQEIMFPLSETVSRIGKRGKYRYWDVNKRIIIC